MIEGLIRCQLCTISLNIALLNDAIVGTETISGESEFQAAIELGKKRILELQSATLDGYNGAVVHSLTGIVEYSAQSRSIGIEDTAINYRIKVIKLCIYSPRFQ